jgi:hypothetical protein
MKMYEEIAIYTVICVKDLTNENFRGECTAYVK